LKSSVKIIVLGSNSFSGAHFVDYALRQGADVIGMSRSDEYHTAFLPYKWDTASNTGTYKFLKADLNLDLEPIMNVVNEFQPDYFVNFAAQSMVAESWENPDHWMQTNVVGTVRLHERLRKISGLKKYVHVSTPEVYGDTGGAAMPESDHYRPSTPYAVSRAAADMSLASYFKRYQFPVVFTRAANVYGPGQQLYRVIPKAILSAMKGETMQLHGGGVSQRSFIHIQDVARGTWEVMRRGPAGEAYHLSTPDLISIKDLVTKIAERVNIPLEKFVEISGERPGKDFFYSLSSEKAKLQLGWEANIGLDQGIEETVAWMKSNYDALSKMSSKYEHKP
jgi:dTDP-glucose 4,6-dehydratase